MSRALGSGDDAMILRRRLGNPAALGGFPRHGPCAQARRTTVITPNRPVNILVRDPAPPFRDKVEHSHAPPLDQLWRNAGNQRIHPLYCLVMVLLLARYGSLRTVRGDHLWVTGDAFSATGGDFFSPLGSPIELPTVHLARGAGVYNRR